MKKHWTVLSILALAATTQLLSAATPPVITDGPASQTAVAGDELILKTTATGTEPLQFRWSWNGVTLAGATTASLLLTNLNPTMSGSYVVTVSNPAGTATALARVQVEAANPAALPISLSGWDADVIVEQNRGPLPVWWFDGGGWQWIGAGFKLFDGPHPDGFPVSGKFTSAANPNVQFQLQPYARNNVLLLSSPVDTGVSDYVIAPDQPTGTLTLNVPARYSLLAVAASSGSLGGVGTMVLHFADGTSSREFPLMAPDWWNHGHSDYWIDPQPPGEAAISGLGRVSKGGTYNNPLGYGFALYESDIDLSAEGLVSKVLTSITFTKPPAINRKGGKGPIATGIFAVSGNLIDPYFASITYGGSDRVALRLKAPTNTVLRVETSVDLKSWSPLLTVTNSVGTVEAMDAKVGSAVNRFYRAVQQP